MIISDSQDLGSLFRRKKKKAPPPVTAPPSTNFNFPMPITPASMPASALVAEAVGPVAVTQKPEMPVPQMAPTVAPFQVGSYLPFIVGGGIVVVGMMILLLTRKTG